MVGGDSRRRMQGDMASITQREGHRTSVKKDRDKAAAIRARQRALGRELRRMYDEVVQEPVPEDFLDILKKIDEANGKADGKKGTESK